MVGGLANKKFELFNLEPSDGSVSLFQYNHSGIIAATEASQKRPNTLTQSLFFIFVFDNHS